MSAESTDSYSFNRRRAVHLNHSHAPFHYVGFPQCHSHSSLGHVHAVVELTVLVYKATHITFGVAQVFSRHFNIMLIQ